MVSPWYRYGYVSGYNSYMSKMDGIRIPEVEKPPTLATPDDQMGLQSTGDRIVGEMVGEMDAQFMRLVQSCKDSQ